MLELLELTTLNKISIILLFLAKFCGILAVVLGFTEERIWGGIFLGLAGVFLVAIFVFCGYQISRQNKFDSKSHAVLQQLMREGSLERYLKDIGYVK